MKSILLPTVIAAALVAGCATSKTSPKKYLFDGKYSNVEVVLNQAGCDTRDMGKCDYRDTIVAIETNNKTAGLRVSQGPNGSWTDIDRDNYVQASVMRQGGSPIVTLTRVGTGGTCLMYAQTDVDHDEKLLIPACGDFPEIKMSWRVVSGFERNVEKTKVTLELLLRAMAGAELP